MCINSTLQQVLKLCVWGQGEGRGRWRGTEQGPWIYNPEGPSPWASPYPSSGYLLLGALEMLSTIFALVILPFTFSIWEKFAEQVWPSHWFLPTWNLGSANLLYCSVF